MPVTDVNTRGSNERPVDRMDQADHNLLLAQWTFSISGDLRFISHRDTMRLFMRALIRAGIPAAYSGGFNPHVKLSLLLPRPVGMATEGDIAVVKLSAPLAGDDIVDRLNGVLPGGAQLKHAVCLPRSARPRVAAADYEVGIGADVGTLPARIDDLMSRDACSVERPAQGRKAATTVDIRPLIDTLTLADGRLFVRATVVEGRTLAMRDLCAGLQLQWTELRHRIIRKRIELA